jgi:membrane-bound lytic murein transglycosylase D
MTRVRFSISAMWVLASAFLCVSCNSALVRKAELMAWSQPPWLPSTRATLFARPALEPPPSIAAVGPAAKDPAMDLLHRAARQPAFAVITAPDPKSRELLDEFRAQELESWKDTPAKVTQQSEPLLIEDLLRLNIPENSRLAPELQKLLLATRSDLPLTLNEYVLRYVNYFLGRGRNTLRESLRRAGSYRPMISRILAEEGVPQDLIYLVQAESGFRPQARSQKKATGMWQFVAWRGREYGLNQNRHVDERLDPEKATHAAARHLADLYAQFGNWYLAMAAYNCGPGGVQRAVERTGYADYWELVRRGVLPRETSNYVPVILAMALLGKNAEAFHLDDIVPESPIDYDTVQTNTRIGIGLIADATNTSVERIKQLNPALLGPATPDGPYSLRIPKNTAERFLQEIAKIPEARRQSWRRHQVQRGETLAQIAARYKVKPQEIATVNDLGSNGLKAGERITIPVPLRPESPRTAVAHAGRAARSGSRGAHLVHYRVRSGETLAAIARRYRVSVAELQRWNDLKGTRVHRGQVLTIHMASAAANHASRAKTASVAGGPRASGRVANTILAQR